MNPTRLLLCLALLCAALARGAGPEAPLQVKVVVVAMFEAGEDTGDAPGEFQFWAEREKIVAEENKVPHGPRPRWEDFAGKGDPAAEFSAEITKWEAEKLKRHAPVKKPSSSPDGDWFIPEFAPNGGVRELQ